MNNLTLDQASLEKVRLLFPAPPELTADVPKTPVGKRLWEPAAASDLRRDKAIDCRGNRTGNGGTTGQTSRLI